jgi:hypothetical protein
MVLKKKKPSTHIRLTRLPVIPVPALLAARRGCARPVLTVPDSKCLTHDSALHAHSFVENRGEGVFLYGLFINLPAHPMDTLAHCTVQRIIGREFHVVKLC